MQLDALRPWAQSAEHTLPRRAWERERERPGTEVACERLCNIVRLNYSHQRSSHPLVRTGLRQGAQTPRPDSNDGHKKERDTS